MTAGSGEPFRKGRRQRSLRELLPTESVLLFFAAWIAYSVLGYFVVVELHVVVGDAVSRLAHAYFVWFNDPPKLTAVGFVWPPLMTLVLLPAALVPPLATSLAALPLTSALFGAGLVVSLDRTLNLLGLPRLQRLGLVALIALNPMIVYYAANGMAETVYLFLLAVAVHQFLRWHVQGGSHSLVIASLALTLGVLTRYELIFWAVGIAVAVAAILLHRRARPVEIEATSITLLAPVLYGLGLWVFFNWLILGEPFHWVQSEVTLTFVETRAAEVDPLSFAVVDVLSRTASLTWILFPATFAVIVSLLLAAAIRRDLMALVLAALIALNPVTTAVLAVITKTDVVFQLRYNLRVVPLALIGVGWLWWLAARRLKPVVAVAGALVLAASIPQTWRAMETYPRQALEQAFTRAVSTGSDQEGTRSYGSGTLVGNAPERAAARWLEGHATGRNSVLADDEESFAVMLYTGDPGLFWDRIDRGDVKWLEAVRSPAGRVEYLLVAKHRADRIRREYPGLLDRTPPGLRRVFDNARWAVFRVE